MYCLEIGLMFSDKQVQTTMYKWFSIEMKISKNVQMQWELMIFCHTDFQHLFCFRWHHSDSWWNWYLPPGQSSREVQVCLHLSFLSEIEKCPHLLLIVYGRVDNRWLARNTSLQNFFFKHIGNQKFFWLSNQINQN